MDTVTTEERPPSLGRIYAPVLIVATIALAADILTKQWADGLELCSSLNPRPTFAFCLAYNEGMAFSFGSGNGAVIGLVAIAIVAVLLVAARKVPFGARLLMGLVAGGALGNVVDRLFRAPAPSLTGAPQPDKFMGGAVIDFVYTSFWATFNVADACIVVGGILLAIAVWRMPEPDDEPDPSLEPEPDLEPDAEPGPSSDVDPAASPSR